MQILRQFQEVFDHSRTEFKLEGEHATIPCAECHKKPKYYRIAKYDCVDCHEEDDSHKDKKVKLALVRKLFNLDPDNSN